MNRENSHIISYLDYYCSLEKSPGFAIMLSGESGVGKTWLIRQYKNNLSQRGIKSLYVSLFGLTSFDEIESSFFEQLHPGLSQQGMGLTAKILKESIKGTINLEIRKQQIGETMKEDWVIPSYLANSHDYILIFDDIDRCFLTVPQIFGYVNFLQEHHGFRVILIGDEESLEEREDNSHIAELGYKNISDKTIGRSFVVQADFSAAFEVGVERLTNPHIQSLLRFHNETIREIFNIAKTANLRHLQHSVLDFERLFENLPIFSLKNDDFLNHLIEVFMIFSLEVRSKNIQANDIIGLKLCYSQLFSRFQFDERKSPHTYLLGKYKKFKIQYTIFSEEWWVNLFKIGLLSRIDVEEEIKNSIWFLGENSLTINKIPDIWNLSDDEFFELQRKIQIELTTQKYAEPAEIKLAVSFLLWANEQGLINKSRTIIIQEARKAVALMVEGKSLKIENFPVVSEAQRRSWHEIPFFSVAAVEFQDFCKYLDEIHEKVFLEKAKFEAQTLLDIMKRDPERFCSIITFPKFEDNKFHDIPILSYITADAFFKVFMVLEPGERLIIAQSLKERYGMKKANRRIIPESGWLQQLINLTLAESEKRQGKLTSFTLKIIVDKLLIPSLERLEFLMMERPD